VGPGAVDQPEGRLAHLQARDPRPDRVRRRGNRLHRLDRRDALAPLPSPLRGVEGGRDQLSPYGIRANCVCPGATDTPGRTASLGDADGVAARLPAIRALPVPRLGTPEEVANAVLFLASAEASYINGVALLVDGGDRAGMTTGVEREAEATV
jgi:hypothetical protein